MTYTTRGPSKPVSVTLIAVLSLLLPLGAVAEQRRGGSGDGRGSSGQRGGGGGERVGTAVPRGGGGGGGRSGGESSGGSGSGRSTAPEGSTASTSGGERDRQQRGEGADGSRPREGRPVVGQAEPRGDSGRDGRTTVIVPGGYYGGFGPWGWGYGGFGFGGYYGGWYDPWYGGFGGYGNPVYYNDDGPAGALRLKVTPHEAQVFVDGYYAGIVDEFDGVFQRLKLEPGPHRIEISSDGYEPLMFEIRALPDRTTTYKGSLRKGP